MILAGIQKLTLIDYPGKLSCVAFTQGCNFACPFCHNSEILNVNKIPQEVLRDGGITEEEFFAFLEKRIGKLDGVTITGGEPTLQADLINFIRKIKSMGFLIKLDSNGTNPKKLEEILAEGLVDYLAMDIKHTPEKYHLAVGRRANVENIKKSVEIIKNSGINYEFRTTVVPTIHEEEDFEEIAKWLAGSKNYYIQEFRPDRTLDVDLPGRIGDKTLDLEKIKEYFDGLVDNVGVRK